MKRKHELVTCLSHGLTESVSWALWTVLNCCSTSNYKQQTHKTYKTSDLPEIYYAFTRSKRVQDVQLLEYQAMLLTLWA